MTFSKIKRGLLGLSMLLAGGASAQSMTDQSTAPNSAAWYFGADIGRSKARIDDQDIRAALAGDGAISTQLGDRNQSTAYKLFGGYQFNDYLAIEGGYFDLGKFGYTATTTPPGTVNGELRFKGLNLDLIGMLPLTDNLSAFGRIGVVEGRTSDEFNSTGFLATNNPHPSRTALNAKLGVGLQYRLTQSLAMRLEAERYRVNDAIGNKGNIDAVSVGLVYRFGSPAQMHTNHIVTPVPAPAPEAPVVAKVIPVAAPMPNPAPVVISLSADSLFGFNRDEIEPEGRKAIDQFVQGLSGSDFNLITVTGHTDRIGNHAANLRLSERRAKNVSAYLITSAGIAAGKIQVRGVDGDHPVTKPGDCPGVKVTKALIRCLQPDRRVDLEVSATK